MRVIEFYDVSAFYNQYRQILLEKEAAGQSLLYYIFMDMEISTGDLSFGSVVDDGAVYLLFCKLTATRGLVVFSAGKELQAEAAHVLADYLADEAFLVCEVRGGIELCAHFIEQYSRRVEGAFVKTTEMDIMELRSLNDVKLAEGSQRLARPDEAHLVADWMIESQLEAKSSEMDYEAMLKKASQYINENRVYFFEKDDMVVSMVIKERRLVNGVLLSYVYTPVEYRGEGYAAANVYYLSKVLLDEGNEFCTMMVDRRNPLSVRSYEKIGYQVVEDIAEYRLMVAEL